MRRRAAQTGAPLKNPPMDFELPFSFYVESEDRVYVLRGIGVVGPDMVLVCAFSREDALAIIEEYEHGTVPDTER